LALVSLLTAPPATAPAEQGGEPQGTQSAASQFDRTSGKVVETMDSGGYTYVRVDTGEKTIWAAAPQFRVTAGERVDLTGGFPMLDYHSKTLDRTFSVLYFVSAANVAGAKPETGAIAPSHQNAGATPSPSDIDVADIERPEGGKRVEELFADRASLGGTEVLVRGKVVRFSPMIMGKNWIHVRDGTGEVGTNDLTVTTAASAAVGDTVLIKGTVITDKDFGFGYRYEVIIEDAEVTVE
jgi:hypothetical protein